MGVDEFLRRLAAMRGKEKKKKKGRWWAMEVFSFVFFWAEHF